MIKNYLFDLDGTLLPLDEEAFVRKYFGLLAEKFAMLNLDSEIMIKRLWLGTKAMIENTGKVTNEEVFWKVFHPEENNREVLKKHLEDFYRTDFEKVIESTNPSIYAKEIIDMLKKKGKRVILATNPIFPSVATYKRLKWAGLEVEDFEYISTYENSYFAKPSMYYYESILIKNLLDPDETIMIGNDAVEDMVAQDLGIKTFLVVDCLNNKANVDITQFERGTLAELAEKIKNNEI